MTRRPPPAAPSRLVLCRLDGHKASVPNCCLCRKVLFLQGERAFCLFFCLTCVKNKSRHFLPHTNRSLSERQVDESRLQKRGKKKNSCRTSFFLCCGFQRGAVHASKDTSLCDTLHVSLQNKTLAQLSNEQQNPNRPKNTREVLKIMPTVSGSARHFLTSQISRFPLKVG